jgi:hypothetical protein
VPDFTNPNCIAYIKKIIIVLQFIFRLSICRMSWNMVTIQKLYICSSF